MRAKKTLGQHFLYNTDILSVLVGAARLREGDTVIEVGPGTGTLTALLVATGANVLAVEKDDALASGLRERYRDTKNIKIIHEDILKFDPLHYSLSTARYALVGNIPYYLTSHLLRTVLESWHKPEVIVFMVQREVAKRMTARPPEMNMLAVLVQYYSTPTTVRIVRKGSFVPPPKVDSAIIKLEMKKNSSHEEGSKVLAMASLGFSHPRKKLTNNMPSEILEKGGIDPSRRAETLTVDEWLTLATKT